MTHPGTNLFDGPVGSIGDTQTTPSYLGTAIGLLLAETPSTAAIIHSGDMGYGTAAHWVEILAALAGQADPAWITRLFASGYGNHDAEDAGATLFPANMTGQQASILSWARVGFNWTATVSGIRFICLDTEIAYSTTQRTWFQDELAIAAKWGLWPVVLSHYCIYSCSTLDTSAYGPTMLPFVQDAEDAGVPLWLCGHLHRYERTVPMALGVPAAGGVTYITVASTAAAANFDPAPTKTDSLDGAPNIVRTDNYDAALILAKQDPSIGSHFSMVNRLDATASTLTWRAYKIIAGPALELWDTVVFTR